MADFGLATEIAKDATKALTGAAGTSPAFAPPELLQEAPCFDEKVSHIAPKRGRAELSGVWAYDMRKRQSFMKWYHGAVPFL